MGVSALELRRRVLMAQPHKERKTGGIVSFKTHVPQVLGVSVPLSPVQAGTGDPYPPGGGVNKFYFDPSGNRPGVQTAVTRVYSDGYLEVSGTSTGANQNIYSINVTDIVQSLGTAYFTAGIVDPVTNISARINVQEGSTVLERSTILSDNNISSVSKEYVEGRTYYLLIHIKSAGEVSGKFGFQISGAREDFAPYSNIRPISGHTGAAVWRTGRNLMQTPPFGVSAAQVNDFGADFQFDAITFSFKANNTIAQYTNAAVVDLREENGVHHYITLSNCKNSEGQTFKANTETSGIYSKTLTNIKFRYVYAYYTGTSYSKFNGDNVTEWQIEPGATASEYAPYSGESFPFTFPGTVYFGTLDAVPGVLTVTHAMWTKNTVDMDSTSANYPGWTRSGIKDIVGSGLNAMLTVFSNIGTRVGVNTMNANDALFLSKAIYGKTKEEWVSLAIDVQVVAELAEPLIVPLTPAEIRALMGENNVFADTGDVDVEFWTN
jgi:hypothetical protein